MLPSQSQDTSGVPKAPSLFFLSGPICTIQQVLDTCFVLVTNCFFFSSALFRTRRWAPSEQGSVSYFLVFSRVPPLTPPCMCSNIARLSINASWLLASLQARNGIALQTVKPQEVALAATSTSYPEPWTHPRHPFPFQGQCLLSGSSNWKGHSPTSVPPSQPFSRFCSKMTLSMSPSLLTLFKITPLPLFPASCSQIPYRIIGFMPWLPHDNLSFPKAEIAVLLSAVSPGTEQCLEHIRCSVNIY